MRLLILGGTVFLGRALTDAALERGHEITHFNRGRSREPDPRVETLRGDRSSLVALKAARADRRWDAIIDTSGYLPQVVRRATQVFRAATERYLFVSSILAYGTHGLDEASPVQAAPAPLPDTMTPAT